MILIRENFLHYLWKHKIFAINKLQTSKNENLQIIRSGEHNLNSGPDFFNAKIRIGQQLWAGNIEIHVKASDWYLHHHEKDNNYDNVILHVVWVNDLEVYHKNNSPIATLELKTFVSKDVVYKYKTLFFKKSKWINCEKSIATIDRFILKNWLEVLYIERIKQKSKLINELLNKSSNDWEEVLFVLLAKNFGLKINGDSFMNLAMSIDFKIIRKEQNSLINIEALLFGQAGFLNENKEETYYKNLKNEYKYLRSKYNIEPLFNGQFQFFRLRPNNFPTVRLAQLSMLYYSRRNLFSKILKSIELEDFYDIFRINTSSYWKEHYNFNSQSTNRPKVLTKQFINLILINTIVPLRFVYNKHIGKVENEDIFSLSKQIEVEKNSILENYTVVMNSLTENNFKIKNAMQSQAFLQLKTGYCDKQKCLFCAIGNSLLKS